MAATSFIAAASFDQRRDVPSAVWSLKWYAYHFHMQAAAKDERNFFTPNFNFDAGINVPIIQSFGWVDAADAMMSFIWTELPKANKVAPILFYGEPCLDTWVNEHSNTDSML